MGRTASYAERDYYFAFYAQDDWRISKNITLNLGLRYEYQGVPSEANNLLGNWEPSVGLEQVGKNISSVYHGDHNNFSPRLGVAWDVTGKGTTVIRAGGSIIRGNPEGVVAKIRTPAGETLRVRRRHLLETAITPVPFADILVSARRIVNENAADENGSFQPRSPGPVSGVSSLKATTSLIEPLMICGMGFIVGGIALGLLMPIFQLSRPSG
jgi:hypothetical protein